MIRKEAKQNWVLMRKSEKYSEILEEIGEWEKQTLEVLKTTRLFLLKSEMSYRSEVKWAATWLRDQQSSHSDEQLSKWVE